MHDDHNHDAAQRRHGHQPGRRQHGVYHYHRQRGWQPHPHGHAARRRAAERPRVVDETVAGAGQAPAPVHQHQHRVSARHVALPRGTAPLVERGTVATYDPASGAAMVRLAGAPARLIGPARVTGCAPRDLTVAGASCLVVLLDPHNPADAVVVALWPPSGAPGSVKLTQAGVAEVPVGGGDTASVTVLFPTPYAAPPVVVATPADPAWAASVGDITPRGFTLTMRAIAAATTGTVAAQWLACGV